MMSVSLETSESVNTLNPAGRVGKASSGFHLHKFSSYKCYIFKSSILNLNH